MIKNPTDLIMAVKSRKISSDIFAKVKKTLIEIILIAASLFLLTHASIIKSTHAELSTVNTLVNSVSNVVKSIP